MRTMKHMRRTDTNRIIKLLNLTPDLLKLSRSSLKMLRNNITNSNITTSSRSSKQKRTSLNLVRNDRILRTMKRLNTTDTDHIRTGTLDIRPHTVQEIRHINNMRLPRSILNDRTASRHRSSHHNINSSTNRNHIQENMAAMQILRLGNNSTMTDINIRTKSTETLQMLVDRPAADITSTRKRNLSILAKQSTKKIIRSTDLLDKLIIHAEIADSRTVDLYSRLINTLNLSPDLGDRLKQNIDVPNIWQILDQYSFISHNGC